MKIRFEFPHYAICQREQGGIFKECLLDTCNAGIQQVLKEIN
jgi:hypothetical protein